MLNDANIESIRDISSVPLYIVTGLVLSNIYDETTGFNSPCADTRLKQWSRFVKDPNDTECINTANISPATYKLYQDLIEGGVNVGDLNFDVVDAGRDHKVCDVGDQGKTDLGKVRVTDGSCWRHTHHEEMGVIDLTAVNSTLYSIVGNMVSFTSTEAFENIAMDSIGKYGDHVEIDSSSPLDDPALKALYTLEYNPNGLVLMCGSPSEVASDPLLSDRGFTVVLPEQSGWRVEGRAELAAQKHTVWTEMALHAPDQLRMKTAWSLSQIVSVGLPDEKKDFDFEQTEPHLAFYDMFVR